MAPCPDCAATGGGPCRSCRRRRNLLVALVLSGASLAVLAVVGAGALAVRSFLRPHGERSAPAKGPSETAGASPLAADQPEILPQRSFEPPTYRRQEVVSRTLQPANAPQTVSHADQVAVTVPGGLLTQPEPLSIAALASDEDKPDRLPRTIARWEIRLGSRHEFDRELTLEFAWNPADRVEEIPVEEQVAVSWWDDSRGAWSPVPFEADETRHRVVVRTRHLSNWEVDMRTVSDRSGLRQIPSGWIRKTLRKKHLGPDGKEEDATVRFWMLPRQNVPDSVKDPDVVQRNLSNPSLRQAGGKAVLPCGDVMVTYFETVWDAYHAARFRLPASMDVYITLEVGESPCYQSMTGNVSLPRSSDSVAEIRANLAHELFHAVQNQYLNGPSMFFLRAWWMDATADFAAAHVAWHDDPAIWRNILQFLKPWYLEQSITYFKEVRLAADVASTMPTVTASDEAKCALDRFHNHHYQTCIFVDYLVRRCGFDFHAMLEETLLSTSTNAIEPLHRFLIDHTSGTKGLYQHYREFAAWFLFSTDSPIPTGGAPETAEKSLCSASKLDRRNPEAEWRATVERLYSAKCWEVRAERLWQSKSRVKITLESMTKDAEGGVRVYRLADRRRVPDPATAEVALLGPAGTTSVEVEIGPADGLYVVAYNGGPANMEVRLKAEMSCILVRMPLVSGVEKGVIGHEYGFSVTRKLVPDDVRYEWTFGDGGTATGERVTHAYRAEGTYRVKVSATWTGGEDADQAQMAIAPDVAATTWEVAFCVYRRYTKPGTDPTTGRPWKEAKTTCPAFDIEIFTQDAAGQTVHADSTSGQDSNGLATVRLRPGSYTYKISYRYRRPVEDSGTQEGRFTVAGGDVVVDVETPSNK